MTVTKRLIISGRVQGVGFRFHLERKARELGMTGWVRNRVDGTVEAMVQGTPEAMEAMIAAARRGPRGAQVTGVQVEDGQGVYNGFGVLPTE